MDERERLAAEIGDEDIIDYFYLRLGTEEVLDRLENLEVKLTDSGYRSFQICPIMSMPL